MIIRGTYKINPIENRRLRRVVRILNKAKTFKMDEPDFLSVETILRKQDNPVTNVKKTTGYLDAWSFAYGYDRTFPLETVELQSFNLKHDKNIESATIHIGQSADEFARSMNFLAFVMADDIYFRSNKFNPTTEEGRKLLAHELTHVAQFKNRGFEGKEELELEADQIENAEVLETDPVETITINGKEYRLRKSAQKKVVYILADKIIESIEDEKILSDEEDYLKLLVNFEDYITGIGTIINDGTEASRRMEEELKYELRRRTGV